MKRIDRRFLQVKWLRLTSSLARQDGAQSEQHHSPYQYWPHEDRNASLNMLVFVHRTVTPLLGFLIFWLKSCSSIGAKMTSSISAFGIQIGRASCRERGESWVVASAVMSNKRL